MDSQRIRDMFYPQSLLPVGTMIITTPKGREIVGHSCDAFMEMWLKATEPPKWEPLYTPPEPSGMEIQLIFTKLAYGKAHKQSGSMRQKKHQRHAALHQVPYKSTTLTNCHPIVMGLDTAAPGVSDQSAMIDVSFNYDAVKMA